jgi:hypothetical protein
MRESGSSDSDIGGVAVQGLPGDSQEEDASSMCDYSLYHVASRSAKLDDKLITTKFSNSITRGFAEVHEPK